MSAANITDQGYDWIDQGQPFNWKMEIDGTEVTDLTLSLEVTLVATEAIGTFKINLNNNNGDFDTLVGGEEFIFYADEGDASTVVFKGVTEKPLKSYGDDTGYVLELEGSHVAVSLLDVTVTEDITDIQASDLVNYLVDTYLSGFTHNNVVALETSIRIKWSNRPFLDGMKEICKLANCDFYVDNDKDFHFFPSGSILNKFEAVVGTDNGNMWTMDGFGKNKAETKNYVIVYGEDEGGLPIIATYPDEIPSGLKETVIKDTDISTYEDARSRAIAEYDLLVNPQVKGATSSLWLLRLNPGEKCWVSNPERQIHSPYPVNKITHKFPELITDNEYYKQKMRLAQTFKDQREKDLANEKIENPFKMRGSYNFDFNNDNGITHAGTSTSEGFLTGSGTCTSSLRTTNFAATSTHMRIVGQDLEASTIEVTADGKTYEPITPNDIVPLTLGTGGSMIGWKITLVSNTANPNPKIDDLSQSYK